MSMIVLLSCLLYIFSVCCIGYSIFLVLGHFPDCEADELLKLMPAVQKVKPKLLTEVTASTSTVDEGMLSEFGFKK